MAHRTKSHAEADDWDLEFWQRQTPEDRLSALVAIGEDIQRVKGIEIKSRIDDPRHRRDLRDLERVQAMKKSRARPKR